MKNQILFVMFWLGLLPSANAQIPSGKGLSPDSLKTAVTKLIDYYNTYEKNNSRLFKREKFDQAFDELTKGSASSNDKDIAFKIVDAYFRTDQGSGSEKASHQQDSPKDVFRNTPQFREIEKVVGNGYTNLMNLPYPVFESEVTNLQPNTSKREIKEIYNKIHVHDGKNVPITAADNEMTAQQQMMWAVKTIENSKNFEEFVKAAKILDPKSSETKLRQKWEKNLVR